MPKVNQALPIVSSEPIDEGMAEKYQYFMDTEPRKFLSPIQMEYDKIFGHKVKVRMAQIGMVRNASAGNRKEVKVFLEPYPHIRIDNAKPLQGWYRSKHDESGRPRTCYTEALLTSPYAGCCPNSCLFCLLPGELVNTPAGDVPVEQLREGDAVWGRTNEGRVHARIIACSSRHKVYYSEVRLEDGRIIRATEDHPFYSADRGWVEAGKLLPGEKLEDIHESKVFQELQGSISQRVQYRPQEASSQLQNVWASCNTQKQLQGLLRGMQAKSYTSNEAVYVRQSEGQEAAQTGKVLQTVQREAAQSEAGCLRSLHERGLVREWQNGQGASQPSQRQTKKFRNNCVDGSLCEISSRRNGKASQRTKVSCFSESKSRGCKARNFRLQTFQTSSIHRQERQNIPDEVNLGSADSKTLGRTRDGLGLRTFLNCIAKWVSVSARLRIDKKWGHSRSQRVYGGFWEGENQAGQTFGVSCSGVGSEAVSKNRGAYVKEVIQRFKEVKVYDIQTTTENFYTQGILVHNCYVNAGGRGYRNTGLVVVPMNYGEQIRQQLKKIKRGSAGYITSFHDPFNVMEGIYHNSQECAKAFTEVGLPIFFLSRLRYPDWAIEALTQNKYSYAQKSINTPDPDDWHKLSPRVPPLDKQFEDIRRLKAKGVYVSIQVNSIIPGVTSNEQILELFKLLADAGADHVITKFVECAHAWAPAMIEKMIENFGDRGRKFAALLNQNIGGEKTIDEDYRMAAHKLFQAEATRLGMTYSVCFEFKWERNADGSIKNKTGISIGPEFTTSAQCHGHRVPVYTRNSAEEMFHPVRMCPPSGCLYCNDNNGGVPKCGNRIAGNALALRMPQLKLPIQRD